MKILTNLLFFYLILAHSLFAQENEFAKLRDAIYKTDTIEDKIKKIRALSYKYLEHQVYYDSAYYYATMAYTEAVANNQTELIPKTIFDQAVVLHKVGDYKESLELYQKSAQISLDNNIDLWVAHAYINMGVIYADNFQDYDKALEYYKKTLEISIEKKDDRLTAYTYINIGDQYLEKKEYITAMEYTEKGTKLLKVLGYETSESKLHLADLHYKLGNKTLAKENALQALHIAKEKEKGSLKSKYEASILLKDILKDEKDHKLSLKYAEEALIYKDSITKIKELNEIEKLQLNFKIKEQKNQLENLALKNKYLNTIYIIVALTFILLIFLISRQLKIARMTKDIHDIQNRLIKPELEKREQAINSIFEATKSQDNDI